MRDWLKRNPWFWIVLLLGAMVVLDGVLVAISLLNAPVMVN